MSICPNCYKEKPLASPACPHCTHSSGLVEEGVVTILGPILAWAFLIWVLGSIAGVF